jgi:predicted RecB family nuclease
MPIAASTLYDFIQCPTRVALDAFGDPTKRDPINPFVRLLWERGTLFERETIAKLDQPFTDLSKFKEEEREQLTLAAMRRGDALIYGGRICADDLIGIPDLLRKEVGGYIPGDIKSGAGEEGGGEDGDGKPKLHYAVQLALYVDILERLGLSAGRRAFVWDINGEEVPYDFSVPLGPKKPWTLWDEYQEALTQSRAILARQTTPLAAYSSVCKFCHWYTFCVEQLTAADDLTLIPRLGRSLRDAMKDTVPSVAALAAHRPDDLPPGAASTGADPRTTTVCRQAPCILAASRACHLGQDHHGPLVAGRPGPARQDRVVHLAPVLREDLQDLGHLVRHADAVEDHLVRLPWRPGLGPAREDRVVHLAPVLREDLQDLGHLVRHADAVCLEDHLVRLPWRPGLGPAR